MARFVATKKAQLEAIRDARARAPVAARARPGRAPQAYWDKLLHPWQREVLQNIRAENAAE